MAEATSVDDDVDRRARVIRASEIGQWAYCARAWWLSSVKGVQSTNTREMVRGELAHQQHGRTVWAAGVLRSASLVLLVIAVLLALAAVLILR